MTKETAEAIGILMDRMTRPVITLFLVGAICWIGLRTVNNISADQFVGIVMAVVLFWFGSRPTTAGGVPGNPSPPTNGGPDAPTPAPAAKP